MPAISVIIPAYNASDFIGRCLGSLQRQTFGDWEAVCVDDGSTDGTGALLDRLAGEDARIRVLHQANAGVSAARNNALAAANGEFILFVDGDDFLHPQAMEICLRLIRRDGSDLVAFTYNRRFRTRMLVRHLLHLPDPRRIDFKHIDEPETLVTDDIFDWATEDSHPDKRLVTKHCQPWRCLYRKELIDGITFLPGIIYEDFPWWSEVLLRVRQVTLTDLPLYFYYPNRTSYIFRSREEFKVRSLETAIPAAAKLYENADPADRERWERNFLRPFQEKLAKKKAKLKNA